MTARLVPSTLRSLARAAHEPGQQVVAAVGVRTGDDQLGVIGGVDEAHCVGPIVVARIVGRTDELHEELLDIQVGGVERHDFIEGVTLRYQAHARSIARG